jgi:hypothetical protein
MHWNIRDGLLTADQRLREIARLLGAALLRLRRRVPPPGAQILPESAPNCLEVSGRPRLSVHGG